MSNLQRTNRTEIYRKERSKMDIKKIALFSVVLLLCFITGCESFFGNPVIGKWSPKNKGGIISLRDMEFTKDMMIYDDGKNAEDRVPVQYEFHGKIVKVIPQAGAFGPFACAATEGNTITCDMPFVGRAVYVHKD